MLIRYAVLTVGIAGLIMATYAMVGATRVRDARQFFSLLNWGKRAALGAFLALLAIEVATAIVADAATAIGGVYMYVMLGWVFLVIVPLGVRTQRVRRARGWPVSWTGCESVEDGER